MSCERKQPICKGVDHRGELLWGMIDMPRWQMEMFRVRYYGDFMAHWIKRQFGDLTGHESDSPSMELFSKRWKAKQHVHQGD
jgi:hypothetical protein